MTYFDIARDAHIVIGSLGLASFWTTAALRKGTPRHRRIGGIYMLSMVGVMVTAVPLIGHAFATGQSVLGAFLGYLVLVTGTAVWTARRAIRERQSVAAFIAGPYRLIAWLNLCGGTGLLAIGIDSQAPLLMGMSVVGLYVGLRMLIFARRPPADRNWWLGRHTIAIVASGAATHVAFLNLGFQRIVPAQYSTVAHYTAWFGPLVVASAAIAWLNYRYGHGLAKQRRPPRSATAQ